MLCVCVCAVCGFIRQRCWVVGARGPPAPQPAPPPPPPQPPQGPPGQPAPPAPPPQGPQGPQPPGGAAEHQGTTTVTRVCSLSKALTASSPWLDAWVVDMGPDADIPALQLRVGANLRSTARPGVDLRLRSRIDEDVLAMGAVTQFGSRLLELWLRILACAAAPPPPPPPPPPPLPRPAAPASAGGASAAGPSAGCSVSAGGGGGGSSEGGGSSGGPSAAPGPAPAPAPAEPLPEYCEFMGDFRWDLAINQSHFFHTTGCRGPRLPQPGYQDAVDG